MDLQWTGYSEIHTYATWDTWDTWLYGIHMLKLVGLLLDGAK